MKKGIIIICATVLFCCLGAKAQNPFKNLTENPAVATYKVPGIVDFVTGYLSDPQDEHASYLNGIWKKHLKNEDNVVVTGTPTKVKKINITW